MKPLKLREGWSIIGQRGIYYAFCRTRRDAINEHCKALGHSWEYRRQKGDRSVKVALYAV